MTFIVGIRRPGAHIIIDFRIFAVHCVRDEPVGI